MIHLQFYANMRSITGQAYLDFPHYSNPTLGKLLERLSASFPELRLSLLDERGNLRPDVPIFVNGRNPRLTSDGINLALESEDVVSFFSPIASGRMNVEVLRTPVPEEPE